MRLATDTTRETILRAFADVGDPHDAAHPPDFEVEVTYDTVELAYASGGSGVFRGVAKW